MSSTNYFLKPLSCFSYVWFGMSVLYDTQTQFVFSQNKIRNVKEFSLLKQFVKIGETLYMLLIFSRTVLLKVYIHEVLQCLCAETLLNSSYWTSKSLKYLIGNYLTCFIKIFFSNTKDLCTHKLVMKVERSECPFILSSLSFPLFSVFFCFFSFRPSVVDLMKT